MANYFHGGRLASAMMPTDQQLPNGRHRAAGASLLAYSKRELVDVQGFDFRLEGLARNAELHGRS